MRQSRRCCAFNPEHISQFFYSVSTVNSQKKSQVSHQIRLFLASFRKLCFHGHT